MWESEWQSHLPTIFMAHIEEEIIRQSKTKPREWKRYIDNIFSLWDSTRQEIFLFIEQANKFHPTMKPHSETQSFIKGIDSEMNLYLTSVLITSWLKHFRTHISPLATHQAEKPFNFLEQTFLKQCSKTTFPNLNCSLSSVDTLKNLYEEHCQKSIFQQDSRLSYKRRNRVNESCLLS